MLPALVTFEWCFYIWSSAMFDMLCQVGLRGKSGLASAAVERLFSGVCSAVICPILFVIKSFVAI